MKIIVCKLTISIFFVLIAWSETGFSMTAEQLKGIKEANEKVTVIDIRNRYVYKECHIPGAINIPASVIDRKHLPPIGRVVVCGDGINTEETLKAVASLNSKPGIEAEKLDGGMQAWETYNFSDTRSGGFKRQSIRYISYQQFEKIAGKNPDLIILDMRNSGGDKTTLSDLNGKFPGVSVLKLPHSNTNKGKGKEIALTAVGGGKRVHEGRFYVLIDDGNGDAEEVAYRLHAAGVKRLAILAGGEIILKADGKAGVETK